MSALILLDDSRLQRFGLLPEEALRILSKLLGTQVTPLVARQTWDDSCSSVGNNILDQGSGAAAQQEEELTSIWHRALSRLGLRCVAIPNAQLEEYWQMQESDQITTLVVPLHPISNQVLVVVGRKAKHFYVLNAQGEETRFPESSSQFLNNEPESEQEWRCLVLACHSGQGSWDHVAMVPHLDNSDHDSDAHGSHGQHLAPLPRLLTILRPDAWDISVAAIYSLVVALLSLATPIAAEQLVNFVGFGSFAQPLLVISLLLFAGLLFGAMINAMLACVAEMLQQRLFVRLVGNLAWRLPRVRGSELEKYYGPELINRFFDVMTVQKSAALLVLEGVAVAIQFGVGMLVLAWYNTWFVGLDLLLLMAFGGAIVVLGRGGIRTAIEESIVKYKVAGWMEQLVAYPVAFKGPGGQDFAAMQADILASEYVHARRRHFGILLRQIVFILILQASAGSLLLAAGGWLVIQGQLTLGQLVAAELILGIMLAGFAKLGKFFESFYDLMAAVDKLGHLLDLSTESPQGEEILFNAPVRLRLQNVSIDLPGSGTMSHVDAEFEPGKITVLGGPPGAGKSLLLQMFYGLRTPDTGLVLINDLPLSAYAINTYREQTAYLHEREVFSGTVRSNVALGRPGMSASKIREVLTRVQLFDEIVAFPRGLDTELHPGGFPLSTSQASRLHFARCLSAEPRLLLVDGFLDNLPAPTIQTLFEELKQLRGKCTVVVISSRQDIQDMADYVMEWPPPSTARFVHKSPQTLESV